MSAGKKVFNNTLILYAKMFITVVPSLYATRLLLKSLGAEDFGLLSLIIGVIAMLKFFNTALSSSSLRFMSYAKGKEDYNQELKIFNISIILHFSLASLLIFVFFGISSLLIDNVLTINSDRVEAAKILFNCLIAVMFFDVISVPYDALINAHEDMYIVALLGIVESLLKLGAVIYISIYSDDKLEMYGYLLIVVIFILFLSKLLFSHRNYPEAKINFKKYYDKQLLKEIFSFSYYNLIAIASQMLSFYGQNIVVNMFFGTIVNAAQGIVNQISGQLSAFANTMQKALNPMIVKSEGAGNRQQMLEASLAGNRLSFFMLMFFYIPVLIELDVILNLWLVKIPPYTILFAKLYFIRNLIDQLYLSLGPAIMSVGKIKRFKIYSSILSILPLPISYIFLSLNYPAYTIYIIFIIYSLFNGALYVFFANRECNMSIKLYFNTVIFKSIISFVLIFSIVFIPHIYIDNQMYRLVAVFITNFLVFIPIIWFLGLSDTERNFMSTLLKKFKNHLIKDNLNND